MPTAQPAILAPVPRAGRFVTLSLTADAPPTDALDRLASLDVGDDLVVGLGEPLVRALGAAVPGLHAFEPVTGAGAAFPSTQGAAWLFVGGEDAGVVLHRTRAALAVLGPAFRVDEEVGTFRFGEGRDLSGYEDGTENPKDERAAEVALVGGDAEGLAGSSFVAVQRWVHDLAHLDAMDPHERNDLVGRDRETNEELPDAPPSAHVKRAAQERFEPEAFMVRRSMPWGDVGENGLYFVAYGASLDPFERVLRHMAGLDDGVVDGLLRFSRAVTGGAYWCPPMSGGRLELRAVTPA